MRIVMHYNHLKGTLTERNMGGHSDYSKGDYLEETIRKEIGATTKRLEKANRNNERLRDDICDLNKSMNELTEKIEIEQTQNDGLLRELQNDICNEKSVILERTQTIDELERMLKEWER